jgi:hypothetical protein
MPTTGNESISTGSNEKETGAVDLGQFNGIPDELMGRLEALIRQRGKSGQGQKKKGVAWSAAQRVTAADTVAAVDKLRPGSGVKSLAAALGVSLATLNGSRGVLDAEAVRKARASLSRSEISHLASKASIFSVGDAAKKTG